MRAIPVAKAVGSWLARVVDLRDVMAVAGLAMIWQGLGGSTGLVAAGLGLFYLGVIHPAVVLLVARRD